MILKEGIKGGKNNDFTSHTFDRFVTVGIKVSGAELMQKMSLSIFFQLPFKNFLHTCACVQ